MIKKRLIIPLLLCVGLFSCRTFATTLANIAIGNGETDLSNQELADANTNFQYAVSLEPTNETANFLYAVTRVLVLEQSTAGSNFLSGLGFAAAGRNYYAWTSLPATNSEGKPEFPKGYNSITAIAFYTNTLMPVLSASLTNLANITDTNFELYLPGTMTGGGAYAFQDVTVDYGDVQVLRSMLSAGQFFGYSLSANNANADMSWIETNIQAKTLTIQSLLSQFPNLAAKQNTGALAPSEQAAINAIQIYFGAATFILDDRTDTNALFNLTTNDIPDEIKFQTVLTNILAALTTPMQLSPNNVDSTLYLAPYFAGNVSLRSLFPKFNGDAYVPDSLPDYTFGGILPDLPPYQTESILENKFPNYAGIYTGDYNLYDNFNYNAGSFAVYVSTNGQLTVVGWDPGDDNYNGTYSTDGSGFGVLVQATLGNGGNWQTSSSAFNAYGSVNKDGTFNGEIDYTNGESVFLSASLAPNLGQFQNSAGYYTGSYSGFQSGSLYSIVAADGEIFFTTGKSGPGGIAGTSGQFYNSDNDFETIEPDGTEIVGIINTNSASEEGTNFFYDPFSSSISFYSSDSIGSGNIVGIYTNIFGNFKGTFTLSRSSKIPFQSPPVITTDLPPGLAVVLGSTTTFQLGVSGSAPLDYQWYFNGSPVVGATSSSLVVSNNLWTTDGTNEIYATVDNTVGGTTSEVCTVTVESTVPPIASYEGIYIGTNSGQVSDSDGYQNGAFAAYVSTNGQLAVVGQDGGDGSGVDGNDFGFAFQTTLVSGGYFQYTTSYLSASGNIDNYGDFSAQLYYPQANGGYGETVYLYGNLESPYGPFQTTDGLYTGTYTGADSGNLDVIFDANSNLFLVPLNPSPNGPYGNAGDGVFGQFFNSTQFSILSISYTLVSGTLNPSTFIINGTYTNSDNSITNPDHGTFTVRRNGPVPILYPPTITMDLPANGTVVLGNTASFNLGVSGSQPLSYEWFFDSNPIAGASTSTLVVSNNVWTTTGTYTISATVANGAGSTNSQPCTVTVTPETNVPTVAITSPASGQLWSNSTFLVSGTAGDKVAVTDIVVVVNGTVYVGLPTNNLTLNNWFVPVFLNPGSNTISAYSINEGGNSSRTATVLMNYVVTSHLTVITNGEGTINPVYSAPVRISQPITLTAAGINGFGFLSWDAGTNLPLTYYTNNATMSLTMSNGLIVQANFGDANKPYLKITNATTGMIWSNENFTVMGVATDDEEVASFTYSLNGAGATVPLFSPIAGWQVPLSLNAGTNIFSAYATATNGNISATQTVDIVYLATNQLTVQISGKGTISPNYSNAWLYVGRNYSMTAAGAPGFKFINWTAETNSGLPPAVILPAPSFSLFSTNATATFMMQAGLVMQANFKDLNPPYLRITNLVSPVTFVTNLTTYTVMGVATDDEQIASVNYSFDGSGYTAANSNGIQWSSAPLPLIGGTNVFSVYAQATNGNYSATDTVEIVMISPNPLTVAISGKGTISPANYTNGVLLDVGRNYSLTASPASGFLFSNWMGGFVGAPMVFIANKPTLTFVMETNLELQADFLDTLKPFLKITNPISAVTFVTNVTSYTVMGVATDDEEVASVNYSFNGGGYTPATTNGIQWSSAPLPLMGGTNVFSVYAQATNGNYSVTDTVDIVMISPNTMTLQISGKGTISPNYSNALLNVGEDYSMTASGAPGFKFINWTAETNPVLVAIEPAVPVGPSFTLYSTNSKATFMMETGLVMQANFQDLNPPFLRISNIVSQLISSNTTFKAIGVATDDEQMASVTYSLNGSSPTNVISIDGWTNWNQQLQLEGGTNVFSVYATATNGNVATDTVKVVSISTNQLTLQISGGKGTISPNYSNAWLNAGENYSMTVSAASGFKFVNWTGTTNGTFVLYGTNPAVTFMMQTGLVMQANLMDTLKPYLKITNPVSATIISNVSSYTVMGVATDDEEVATVNYSFNGTPSSLPISNNIAAWQAPVTLSEGTNTFSAWAVATNGNISATSTVTIIRWPTVTVFPIATNDVAYPAGQGAFDGTNYLVVYQGGPAGDPSAAGQFVSTTGTLEGSNLSLNLGGVDSAPYIDFDGTNYLVAWADYSVQGEVPVKGVFVNPVTQETVGNVLTLSQSTKVANFGSLAFGGGLYFLMWSDTGTTPASMHGALIDTSGTNVSGDFLIGTNGTESTFAGPQAAYDGTNFLAVWSSATGKMIISGEFVNASGPVGSPFVIYTNSGSTGYTAPSVVFNGTNYLVLFNIGITSSSASASGFHILGRLVTADGTVLTNQISLTSDAGPQIVPGADFNGTNFLASWNQGWNLFSATTSGYINGRFLNAQGNPTSAEFPIFTTGGGLTSLASVLQPPVIKVSSGYTATWAPVFFDGSKYVLVGGFGKLTSNGFTNSVIYGAFVSP